MRDRPLPMASGYVVLSEEDLLKQRDFVELAPTDAPIVSDVRKMAYLTQWLKEPEPVTVIKTGLGTPETIDVFVDETLVANINKRASEVSPFMTQRQAQRAANPEVDNTETLFSDEAHRVKKTRRRKTVLARKGTGEMLSEIEALRMSDEQLAQHRQVLEQMRRDARNEKDRARRASRRERLVKSITGFWEH